MALTFDRNLGLRVISALVALPLVLGTLYLGGKWFFVFVFCASWLILRELFRLVGSSAKGNLVIGLSLILVFLISANVSFSSNVSGQVSAGLVLAVSLLGLAFTLFSLRLNADSSKMLWQICAISYVLMLALPMLWLSYLSKMLVLWLLLSVWASDIGGYFAGRLIGGPKLAPKISPKKTWAGSIGGILLAACIGYSISTLGDWWNPMIAAIAAAAVAILSQLGDLYESALKRRFHVKDSGGLMPGHGGLLDRIDGLAVAAACVGIYESWSILKGTL